MLLLEDTDIFYNDNYHDRKIVWAMCNIELEHEQLHFCAVRGSYLWYTRQTQVHGYLWFICYLTETSCIQIGGASLIIAFYLEGYLSS